MSKYRSVLVGDFKKLDHGECVRYVYSDELKTEDGRDYLYVDGDWIEIDKELLEFSLNIRDVNGIELMENDVVSFSRDGENYLGMFVEVGGYAEATAFVSENVTGVLDSYAVGSGWVINLFDGNDLVMDEDGMEYVSFPFDELITNIQREHAYQPEFGFWIEY